jgi:polysaccharide deacetylase family protein (PEP-CTERM system associated)
MPEDLAPFTPKVGVVNALTIDVEDYFQVSAFTPYILRSTWDDLPCRVERNVDRILELLTETGVHATFFTLGWIAERYPQMVGRIVSCGHEVASHGYAHDRANALTPEAFFADVALAKAVLEDIAGTAVQGYRAPSFSIGDSNPWAYECLAKAGYRYSSSVYPIRHDHYGSPGRLALRPYVANTQMLEVPTPLPVCSDQLSGRRRWLFPPHALCRFALADPTGELKRRGSGDFLFSPLGTRS